MFVEAIERVESFVRPILSIVRYYGSSEIIPACSTLFFVNEHACALTCQHVARQIEQADDIYRNYLNFKGELRSLPREVQARRTPELEQKYGLRPDRIIRLRNLFTQCVDQYSGIRFHFHPTQDLAVIQFVGYQQVLYRSHAFFLRDSSKIRQGKYLCRLGFPFPEFNNYRYNPQIDDIEWTAEGRSKTPRYPIDGIVTRNWADNGEIVSIEMSTPGLKGHSGGPLFDTNGTIYGMQYETRHLHLGFDLINHEVTVNGRRQRVTDHPFLHVGRCVHVDVIKRFLRDLNIKFYEE